jgi:hypothetical protein
MACLVPFRLGLAFYCRALEPRAHEVDQGLARLYRTTLTHLLGKGGGVRNVVLPSMDEFRRSPVSC